MLAVSHGCSRYALEKHSMSDLVSPVRALVRITSRLARASYGFAVNRHDNSHNNDNPCFLEFIAQVSQSEPAVTATVTPSQCRITVG